MAEFDGSIVILGGHIDHGGETVWQFIPARDD
jgi:hypothetical protein